MHRLTTIQYLCDFESGLELFLRGRSKWWWLLAQMTDFKVMYNDEKSTLVDFHTFHNRDISPHRSIVHSYTYTHAWTQRSQKAENAIFIYAFSSAMASFSHFFFSFWFAVNNNEVIIWFMYFTSYFIYISSSLVDTIQSQHHECYQRKRGEVNVNERKSVASPQKQFWSTKKAAKARINEEKAF